MTWTSKLGYDPHCPKEGEFYCDSEWGELQVVLLLFLSKDAFEAIGDNYKDAMFISKPNYELVMEEFWNYVNLLKKLGIRVLVHEVDEFFPNIFYARDLAVITPDGRCILANPKYRIRKGEEKVLYRILLSTYNSDERKYIFARSTMEAADLFWLNNRSVTVSVGNRTSPKFADELKTLYPDLEIRLFEALPEQVPQHILGHKHIVSHDCIILRSELGGCESLGFKKIIHLKENHEVVNRFSMNIVTIDSYEIVMPDGCEETKRIFESHGIRCHTVYIEEILKMGGGLACMTLPLKRKEYFLKKGG